MEIASGFRCGSLSNLVVLVDAGSKLRLNPDVAERCCADNCTRLRSTWDLGALNKVLFWLLVVLGFLTAG